MATMTTTTVASTATTPICSPTRSHHRSTTPHRQQKQRLSRAPRKSGIATNSTPNLSSLYSSHARLPTNSATLGRKASFAALTHTSLASIPDDTENWPVDSSTLIDPRTMAPATPGRPSAIGYGFADDIHPGDNVDVPGNMTGTVRFVGSVNGRKGNFAGVELHGEFASRGKNSGDVDGVSYFTTSNPGSGIFVPVGKLFKMSSPTPRGKTPVSALKVSNQNATNFTPPTPSLPKFSQSVGPGRAPSPQGKRPRTSLPRPDSPVRRLQMTPGPRPTGTPGPRAPRYGSPTNNKFSASVRGTLGDPHKPAFERKPSLAPRSVSAMGHGFDDENEANTRNKTNGSIGSISSLNFKRPASRANHANEEEMERLKSQLEERDRQLKEQASALAEMESSLVELTSLIEQSDHGRPNSLDGKDTSQLRAMLREKNEKIAMLTAEFDAHRADFRSTIDTLEMASTETQRVYDAKIREMEEELREANERNNDVDGVALQLKQLEELVQELEEGLEDARRGEAEARGEVEFLRGEVERTRTELRREREKASAVVNEGEAPGDKSSMSKELEQKDDEIRGLKAIIHSLSRDSIPGTDSPEKTPTRTGSFMQPRPDSLDSRLSREKLERELFELRGLLDTKNNREEELEREIENMRRGSVSNQQRGSLMTVGSTGRSSYRDSKGTVILARDQQPQSPNATHKRTQTLDSMPEVDNHSSVTETSTLWCEICETAGHDILTCSNMFGSQQDQSKADDNRNLAVPSNANPDEIPRPLTPMKSKPLPKPPVSPINVLPDPRDSGPLAGKDSGVVDASKWCALCERDGHDSIDCPLEDAF